MSFGFGKTTTQSSKTYETTNIDNSTNNTDNRSVVGDGAVTAGAGATVSISQSQDSINLAKSIAEASLNTAAAASKEVAELANRSVDTVASARLGEGTPASLKTYAIIAAVGLAALVGVAFILKGR